MSEQSSLTHRTLQLRSGGTLNLYALPQRQLSFEMLEACRDRIFALQACLSSPEAQTPTRPRAARVPASTAKKPSAAQIAKEKKSIVKDINPPEHPTAREPPNDRGAKL